MRADAAKLIVIVLVFPLFAWMFDLSSLWNLVQGIPIFDTWLYILMTVNKVDPGDLLMLSFNAFFEAALMGLFVGMFRKIGKLLKAQGNLPILSTFLGLALGCIVLRLLSFAGVAKLLLELGLLVLGIVIMVKGTFRAQRLFSVLDGLALLADSLLAVAACGLVVAYTMFSAGSLSVGKLLGVMGLMLVMSVLAFLVGKLAEE